ncbi:putative transmembrane protein [Rhizoctonia solani 123E]|uniref:Putative transmembrane protein n=1 Tax=Rhizoctonia solani 123E TaxID=1423351 RepID=A0A074SJ94_9AGAM|nr:putative transmembrane protein [Rhizoctonia solani 123E]
MSRILHDSPEGGAPNHLTNSPVQENVDLPTPSGESGPSGSFSFRPQSTISYDPTLTNSLKIFEEDELTEMPSPITPSRRRESVASWSSTGRTVTSTVRLNNPPTPGGRRPPSRMGTIGGMSVEETEQRFMSPQQEFYDDNGEDSNEELGIRANIWPAYLEEAWERDSEMLDAWHKSLDVLLIFAALFSSLLSQLLGSISAMLQPDSGGQTVELLAEILRATQNPGNASSTTSPDDILKFTPSSGARWVNGLWFMSLGLSLTAALAAVLAKEWLAAYVSDRPTQPKKRAIQRQRRRESLDRWMLPAVISILPMLMHASLLIFFVGLIIWLWMLDLIIAITFTVMFVAIILYYFGTTGLAIMYPNCPYQTPVATYMRPLFYEFGWVRESVVSAAEMTARALAWVVTSADDNQTRDTAVLAATAVPGGAHAVVLAESGARTLALTRLEDMLRRVSSAANVHPGGELAAEKIASDAIPDALHLIHAYLHLNSIHRYYRFALDTHTEKVINVRRHVTFLDKCAASRFPGARALVVALRVSDGREDRDEEIYNMLKGHADGNGRLPSWALHKLLTGAVYHRIKDRPEFAKRILPYVLKTYVRSEEISPPLRQAFVLTLSTICVPKFDLFALALTLEVVPMELQKRIADAFVVQALPRLFDSQWSDCIDDLRSDLLLPLSVAAQAMISNFVYKELIQDMRWDVALKAPAFKKVAFPCLTQFTGSLNDRSPLQLVESYALEMLRTVSPKGLFALPWLSVIHPDALQSSLFPHSAIPIILSTVKEELSGGQDNPHARGIVSGACAVLRILCNSPEHQAILFKESTAETILQILQLGRDAKFEFKADMIRAATDVAFQLVAACDTGAKGVCADPAALATVRYLLRANILGVLRPYFDNLGLPVSHILIWASVLLRVWCSRYRDAVVESGLVGWLRKDALAQKMHQNKEHQELWKQLNDFNDRVRNRKHLSREKWRETEEASGELVAKWESACKKYREMKVPRQTV